MFIGKIKWISFILLAGLVALSGCDGQGEFGDGEGPSFGDGFMVVDIFNPENDSLHGVDAEGNPLPIPFNYSATEGSLTNEGLVDIDTTRLEANIHKIASKETNTSHLESVPINNLAVGAALPRVNDGLHKLEFKIRDADGNLSIIINTYFRTDYTPANITAVTPGDVINDPTPVLTYTIDDACWETNSCNETVLVNGVPVDERNGQSLPALNDGNYTVEILYVDEAGNRATTSYTFTVDATPPEIIEPARVPAPDPTQPASPPVIEADIAINVTDANVVFTSSESGSATVNLDGTSVATLDVQAGVENSVPLNGLSTGTHTVNVTVTDTVNNTTVKTYNFQVDLDAPALVVRLPKNLYNTRTVPIATEVFETGLVMNYQLKEIDQGIIVTNYVMAADLQSLTVEADGAYELSVTATDPAGNFTTVGTIFTVDTTPPLVEITSPAHGSTVKSNAPILTVDSTEEASYSVKVYLWEGEFRDYTLNDLVTTHLGEPLTGLVDNRVYTVVVEITDQAGWVGSSYSTFTVDAQGPFISIINPENNEESNNGKINLKYNTHNASHIEVYVASPADPEPIAPVAVREIIPVQPVPRTYQETLDKDALGNPLGNGTYTIIVKAFDRMLNNHPGTEARVTVRMDNDKPSVGISSPGGEDVYYNSSQNVSLSYTVSNADSMVVKVDGIIRNEITLSSSQPVNLGTFATEGAHSVTLEATNANGTSTVTRYFHIDNTAPIVSIISPASGSTFTTGQSISLEYYITDRSKLASGVVRVNGTVVDNAGSGYDLSGLGVGTHTVEVSVTDMADQTGGSSTTFTIEQEPVVEEDDDRRGKSSCYFEALEATGGEKGNQFAKILRKCTSDENSRHHR